MDTSTDSLSQLRFSTGDSPEADCVAPERPRSPVRPARGRGLRTARLDAIKADAAENAGKSTFSISEVAARHGISARHIRRLFEGSGMTFTAFTREQRLLAALRMLNDRCSDQRAIGAIAFDAGFGDLSYFNRVFRQRFGATPSEIRAAARAKQD